ncbi:hypothetical protein BB561_000016 [Smittium simulii]|uniref:Uncharacterized protein n=1 Tax=Smittium simulii TaxID=133385 RepID=A0A2T9YQE3_9FUNG|nr:hypothetical protein BB561_002436 [Smittium simulii]PVU98266.1 hypothetical protein BB561_000016 [Smittium simulii]
MDNLNKLRVISDEVINLTLNNPLSVFSILVTFHSFLISERSENEMNESQRDSSYEDWAIVKRKSWT